MESSLLAVLKSSQIAAGQTPSDLISMVRQLETVTLGAGSTVVTVGDAADAAYLLMSGMLEIRDGDGTLLDTEAPGALVGEQALMPGGSGTRSASIVAATDSTLLRIDTDTFQSLLARNRAALEATSEARTRNRLSKQARPLRALLDRGVQKIWEDGAVLFREGDASDGMHLVMGGQAEVAMTQGGELVHIATVYPGQVFGEIGVLQSVSRTASVVARNHLRTIFVAADEVRSLQAADPDLESFLKSLLRSRELPRLGIVHQNTVVKSGEVCIQTIFSLNDGRELVGLRTPGGHYTLVQTDATTAEIVKIAATNISLDRDGRIVGFDDNGDYEDINGLQILALEGTPLTRQQRRSLKKAAKATADLAPDAIICRCLNVERQVIQASIDQGATTITDIQEATGSGTGCGGCLRKIVPMLSGAPAPRPATPTLRPPRRANGNGLIGWLRGALGS